MHWETKKVNIKIDGTEKSKKQMKDLIEVEKRLSEERAKNENLDKFSRYSTAIWVSLLLFDIALALYDILK